jgi:hypothetical protein
MLVLLALLLSNFGKQACSCLSGQLINCHAIALVPEPAQDVFFSGWAQRAQRFTDR